MKKLYILFLLLTFSFTTHPLLGGLVPRNALEGLEVVEHLMDQAAPVLHEPPSISSSGFLLVWTPSSGATSYILDIAYNSSFTSFVSGYQNKSITGSNYYGSQLALVVDPLEGNMFYYCRLRAVGPGGTSSYSNVIEVPISLAPSTVPILFVHYANSSTLYLSWEQSSGSTYYELDVAYDASFSSYVTGYNGKYITGDFGTGNISYSVTGLRGKTKYYCRVRGAGPSGTTAYSNVISASTSLAIPGAPVVKTVIDITTGSATLSWDDVHMADVYRLDVATNSSFDNLLNGYDNKAVSATTFTIDGLSANTTYYYRARATNTLGSSGNSNVIAFTTIPYVRPSQEKNHILTYTPVVEGLNSIAEVVARDVDEVNVSVQYLDGLGRPSQTVNTKASPGQKDIVQPVYYDGFGRESRNYLPYVDSEDDFGSFRADVINSQANFYNAPPSGVAQVPVVNGAIYSYSETIFEASPLSRVTEQGRPGAASQPEIGHTVKIERGTNNSHIALWTLSDGGGAASYVLDGQVNRGTYYDNGELYKTITKDENWTVADEEVRTVEEFTDKLGRLVLKRVYRKTPYLDGYIKLPHDTYYIYDDFGNLRYVLPPSFQGNSFTESSQNFKDYIFAYHYDHRNRMVEKKVPGTGWVSMVYDKRDRLVLTQDGNQRKDGVWSFIKYDALNRPISTGLFFHPDTTQLGMQGELDAFYAGVPANSYYEERSGPVHGYTNRSFPQVGDEESYLTVTYYDNYGFKGMIGDTTFDFKDNELVGQRSTENSFVRGLLTGTKTRVLGTDEFLWGVIYYDKKYRPIQTVTGNYPEGMDRVTSTYNFPGWLMETRISHEGNEVVTMHMGFDYDHMGRLLAAHHSINGGDPVRLSSNEFNELGQLVKKHLHREDNSFVQSVDYRYNIRGWLKRINNSDLSPDVGDHKNDLFGMELFYEDGFEVPQYNGNISGTKWKNGVDNMERAYGYTYDPMNRLTGADYVAGGTGNWTKEENRFEVGNISYDANGNIRRLHRNGVFRQLPMEAAEYGVTDQLTYRYRGNQLMAVNDAMDTPEANVSDFRDNGSKGDQDNPEYGYDANGNMVRDDNKGITVEYNHLNLPKKVDFGNNKYIEYTYDATGIKLQQKVHDGQNPVKQTDYVGGMVYEDGQLQFIHHDEGRVVMVDSEGMSKFPEYQYHLKDHLGNVRLTFSASPEIESNTATMEIAHEEEEYATFLRYVETTKINSMFFDHTNNGDTHYAIRLNGSVNERRGLAKSLAVMTGDTVKAEVYAKYLDPDQNNWTAALQNLMAAIAGGTAPTGTVIEAVPPVGGDNFPFEGLLDAAKANDTGTRAYLNILLFDEGLEFLDAAFVPVTMAAKEDGTNVPHEKLSGEIVVQQPGYAYIYFSNDNGQPLEVFFDDFTVTHSHSAIVQADDYYPFGLTFNSYRRELGKLNEYLYQGKERSEALGWDDFHARMYSPALGRFFGVDPQDQFVSPFVGMGNNPIIGVDPDGEFVFSLISKLVSGDINNAGDFFRTIFTGSITDAFNSVATLNPINILSRDIGVVTGLWNGVFNGNWERLGNTGEIFLGQFYTDNNRSVSSEIWQGISRNTTEHTQTTVGYNYSQWRNTVGKVDRVDLFAGATFVTGENQHRRNGVSLGNFININLRDEITGSFESTVINDPLFMHEYGHTFDSQNFGPLYLYAIGVPSAISASRARRVPGEPQGVTTHDFRWYEMSANRHASRYFGMYHGVDWNTAPWGFGATYETFFPRRRR